MTKLKCNAINCFHNREKLCCLSGIEVDGANAEMSDGTACVSFREKTGASIICSCSEEPTECSDIQCKAKNCVYNAGCRCTANSVDVEGASACTCGETKCATFKAGM